MTEPRLSDLLEQYNIDFNWDDESLTWYLSGTNESGEFWESPHFEADTRVEAEVDAIEHIVEYHT